jgi:putative NIF3 family GTP cyclohydrolase 1 type 2
LCVSRIGKEVIRDSGIPRFLGMTARFNGLMLRGAEGVNRVVCAVLPTPEVLGIFIEQSKPGDLFFTHHPIDFEMGDPRNPAGRGPIPIERELLDAMVSKQLSLYACHMPLDIHAEISTGRAMERALNATRLNGLYAYREYFFGSLCTISAISTQALADQLKLIFEVPYVDVLGAVHERIERVAIIPGAADKVEVIQEAEANGAQALVSGEVISHRQDEYGRAKHARVKDYLPETRMSLIGVSHAASEHLVMETHMRPWFEKNCQVQAETIRMPRWWR